MGKATVFAELSKVTKVTEKDGEGYQKFAFRVAEGIAKLDDDQYGKLSDAAQKWFADATAILNANEGKADQAEIPAMPGYGAEAEQETKEEKKETKSAAPESKEPEKAAKKSKDKKEAPKPVKQEPIVVAKKKAASKPKVKAKEAPKKAAKKAEPKEAKEANKDGIAYKVRVIAIKKPDTEWDAVVKQLGLKGAAAKENTYAFFRFAEAKRIMRIVNELR